jgi:hypothetical protein
MVGRVQNSITIRVGSLWIDVPMGPLVNHNVGSLRTGHITGGADQ